MRRTGQGRRHARALASLVLVMGLIGVGELPAGAGPSGVGGVADDVPQPQDEVVPFVRQLID